MLELVRVVTATALNVLPFQVIIISPEGLECQRLHLFVSTEHASASCHQVYTPAKRRTFHAK